MKSIIIGALALMALVIAAFATQPQQNSQPNAQQDAAQPAGQAAQDAGEQQEEQFVYIQMTTSKGDIFLELNNEKAPISTENFVTYAKSDFYDGTIFHRVIEDFMIQGGGLTADMEEKETRAPIKNESDNGLLNKKMTVAMARTPLPNSATSQFFINLADNDFLNRAQSRDGYGYAVFGKVVEGQDVVNKIAEMPTRPRGVHSNVPVQDVVIESARVVEN